MNFLRTRRGPGTSIDCIHCVGHVQDHFTLQVDSVTHHFKFVAHLIRLEVSAHGHTREFLDLDADERSSIKHVGSSLAPPKPLLGSAYVVLHPERLWPSTRSALRYPNWPSFTLLYRVDNVEGLDIEHFMSNVEYLLSDYQYLSSDYPSLFCDPRAWESDTWLDYQLFCAYYTAEFCKYVVDFKV